MFARLRQSFRSIPIMIYYLLHFFFWLAVAHAETAVFISFVISGNVVGDPTLWAARCVSPAYSLVSAIACARTSNAVYNGTALPWPSVANCTLALAPNADPNVVIDLLMTGARHYVFNNTTPTPAPSPSFLATWWPAMLGVLAALALLLSLTIVLAACCHRDS